MLLDVDGLKGVNDVHGHEAGDALLLSVATTLRRHTRGGDVVVRWGGDEFIVLAPQMAPKTGLRTPSGSQGAVRDSTPGPVAAAATVRVDRGQQHPTDAAAARPARLRTVRGQAHEQGTCRARRWLTTGRHAYSRRRVLSSAAPAK